MNSSRPRVRAAAPPGRANRRRSTPDGITAEATVPREASPAPQRGEAALADEHARLELAVALGGLGLWELEAETHTLTASAACRAHFGVGEDAPLTLEAWLEQIHVGERVRIEAVLQAALAHGADFTAEFRVLSRAGEPRWISIAGRRAPGRPGRLVGASRDVTRSHDAAALLERSVDERTTALRENVAELETFAYSLSHDLQTPLRALRTYATVLSDECGSALTPHGRHYVTRIAASASQMQRLVQDILAFSRTARDGFEPQPVDLDRLTHAVIVNAQASAPTASILVCDRLPWVLGDPTAITQCVSNLLDNAVKFVAPLVAPRVQVWAEPVRGADGADRMRLNIRDNGIGIPKTAQSAIFELFQRAHRNYEGTGLGLAIVRKAAARMGGTVGVSSEPGAGSVFWLELPRARFATEPVLT